MPLQSLDITGRTFGKWFVMEASHKREYWICKCECGNEKPVRADALKSGDSLSCGCGSGQATTARFTTHGVSRTPEYQVWANMVRRCHDDTHKQYSGYGGRGITVCDRWRESVQSFLEDMGKRPSPKHTLDRRDNDLGYSPENCRWVVATVQARNKRSTVYLTLGNETLSMPDWAERTGIGYYTLKNRRNMGWDDERTLTTPIGTRRVNIHD